MFSPNSNSADKLYLSYYSPYEVSGTNRSGNEGEVSLQVKAMQKFEQKDYEGAIKIFDEMKTNDKTNLSSNFYKGIAYLEMNKPNEAIKSLEIVIKNENNELIADAEWYLGLAYLKANDLINAKKQFIRVSENYSFYKKKADEIIIKIK
jgi:tetratricopeptide (TPR) repeat protein